jgi:hypothetical protein
MNLLDAVRLACAPESRGKGVLVAFNGEINAGRDVTKTNTYHLQTFRTRDLGLLGYIDPDKIEYYRTPHRRHTVNSGFSRSQGHKRGANHDHHHGLEHGFLLGFTTDACSYAATSPAAHRLRSSRRPCRPSWDIIAPGFRLAARQHS